MKNPSSHLLKVHLAIRLRIYIFKLLILSFVLNMVFDSSLFAQVKLSQEEDFFYSNGQKVPVMVSKNAIGLLAKDGISANQIKELSDSLGLGISAEFPGGIFVFTVKDTLPRMALVNTARMIKRTAGNLIAQTGLLVTPSGAETPMIGSDEFIVQFNADVTKEQIEADNRSYGVIILMENPFVSNQYLLQMTVDSKIDVLNMANRYHENERTKYAHPNFIPVLDERQFIPDDPLFGNQWHHRNTGQTGGTRDADIDAELAWDFTLGNANVIIAVIDGGFDMTHPDLIPNFWANPGEVPGNGIDDDGNTFIDDINGWDFTGCTATSGPGCGDNNPTGGNHGTSVAGTAAARGNNNLGVSGSCPNCGLMLIRRGTNVFAHGLSFGYAQQMGAQIITNSWGYSIGTPATTNVVNAINAAAAAGSVIFFAMNNPNVNDCIGTTPDISSIANVIGVSRSTNRDRFDLSGFGNCMDLLAPSAGCNTIASGRGTLWATTTDVQGNAGYNNGGTGCVCPSVEPAPPPGNARDYTFCFNGTSFSAPLAAGVAGLILSANPGLTRVQVQRLLQDAADKIEDSAGDYDPFTGFSSPATGQATHGWGRVNAFEAVRIVASAADSGKDGIDVFLRDNRLDWGNTEQPSNTLFEPVRGFIGHWRSMDIKVDAPPYQPAPTALTFDTFLDETPSAVTGDINRVYVRVRNRGPIAADSVTVKLHWTQFGTALPVLPTDFWTAFPNNSTNTTQWHPLTCGGGTSSVCRTNVAYSGSSVANTAADVAQIVQFQFPAPVVNPALSNHFCLLAMIDHPQDRILPKNRPTRPSDFVVDQLTPTDNNVTHRNYTNLQTSRTDRFQEGFYVRNPTLQSIKIILRLQAPEGWRIVIDQVEFDEPFSLAANQEMLVTMRVSMPEPNLTGDVTIIQERVDIQPTKVLGGVTYQFKGEEKASAEMVPSDGMLSAYLTGTFDLRNNGNTNLHIINPTAKHLRVIIAFFDDNERPIRCLCDSLSPNDLLEINVKKHLPENEFGVIKVVSLNREKKNVPEIGIIGYQRHNFIRRGLFKYKLRAVSETVLHSIPGEILKDDLKYIWPICEKCIRGN